MKINENKIIKIKNSSENQNKKIFEEFINNFTLVNNEINNVFDETKKIDEKNENLTISNLDINKILIYIVNFLWI